MGNRRTLSNGNNGIQTVFLFNNSNTVHHQQLFKDFKQLLSGNFTAGIYTYLTLYLRGETLSKPFLRY